MSLSRTGENLKESATGLFYVKVKEPIEVKRLILETLRDILEVLHKFEKFKHIRHEKIENINKLRVLLKGTNKMLGHLKERLPKTDLKAAIVREAPAHHKESHLKKHHKKGKKGRPAKIELEKAPNKEITEVERIESELNAIENKLKNMA